MKTIPALVIAIDRTLLTEQAAEMVRLMERSPNGRVFQVRPHGDIRLKSLLTRSERIRRFGQQGTVFADDAARDAYISRIVACYGDDDSEAFWTLPTDGVGRIDQADGAAGAKWLNAQAAKFYAFLERGDYEAAHA